MNKLLIAVIILFGFVHVLNAQSPLLDLLDSLSVKQVIIDTKVDSYGSNYFAMMQNKKNYNFRDKVVVYINSYNHFSIFYMFPSHSIGKDNNYKLKWNGDESLLDDDWKESPIMTAGTNPSLLFDTKNHKCYMIKSIHNKCFFHTYKNVAAAKFSSNFNRYIYEIYELNNELMPLWSVEIKNNYPLIKYNDIQNHFSYGDFLNKSTYFVKGDSLMYNVESFSESFNINDFSYCDLLSIFETFKREINIDLNKDDNKKSIESIFRILDLPSNISCDNLSNLYLY